MSTPAVRLVPERIVALAEDFLRAIADPEAGTALHALYAPEAQLVCQGTLHAAGTLSPDAYGEAHRQAVQAVGSAPLAFSGLSLESWEADGADRGLAWFSALDPRGRTVWLAFGLVCEADALRIAFLTLTPRREVWDYAWAHMQAVCELAPGIKKRAGAVRSALDVAYYRHFGLEETPLLTLSGARFSCQGSGDCCNKLFSIELEPDLQQGLDAIPWARVAPALDGITLPVNERGKLQLKRAGERCRFLDGEGRCVLHKALGRQLFGPCAVFPFAFAETPEGVTAATSFSCSSARLGLGEPLVDRRADLRDRLAHVQPLRPEGGRFRFNAEREVDWEVFRTAEDQLRRILADASLPLARRLWLGLRYLERGPEGVQLPLEADWYSETWLAPDKDARDTFRQGLIDNFLTAIDRRQGLSPALSSGDVTNEALVETEALAGLLGQFLFSKIVSYRYDLTAAFNLACALHLTALHVQSRTPGAPIAPGDWQQLGALAMNGLITKLLEFTRYGDRAHWGSVAFGAWLLRQSLETPVEGG